MPKPWNVAWALSANVGDGMAPWLVEKLTGVIPFYADSMSADYENFIVTGSVAGCARAHSICWAPGIMFAYERPNRNATWLAVRGPLTRSAINVAGGTCPPVFGDPAILLPRFCPPAKSKKYELSIIPHYIDQPRISAGGWIDVCIRDGINVINVFDSVENICRQVSESERVISSSLHGCIIADTYNVPWCWAKFSNNVGGDDSKFIDYFLSMGREEMSFTDLRGRVYAKDPMKELCKFNCSDPDRLERMRNGLMAVCPFTKG
jgi:pyruvyltransferase